MVKIILLLVTVTFLTSCEEVVLDPLDPYENSGEYGVKQQAATIPTSTSASNLTGVFYYPNGTFSDGSRTLIILTHGFSAHYYDYAAYAEHLASHGHYVLGFDFIDTSADPEIANHDDKAIQVKEAIDFALNSSAFAALFDQDKIIVMGHSLGGKISFMAAAIDDRIDGIIALDPSNAGGPPCFISAENCANYPAAPNPGRSHVGVLKDIIAADSLIFRSVPDGTNPEEEFNAYYFFYGDDDSGNNATPPPSYYIDFSNYATHASYVPVVSSNTTAIVKRTSAAWLAMQFYGIDTSAYFTGSKMQNDINANRVKRVVTRF